MTDAIGIPDFSDIHSILQQHSSLIDGFSQLQPVILKLFTCERVTIYQRRRQQQDLVAKFKSDAHTVKIEVAISPQSIAGYVALSKQSLLIPNPQDADALRLIHPRLCFAEQYDQFVTRNILCVPIVHADVLLGVFQLINKQEGGFTESDVTLAQMVAEEFGKHCCYELGGTLRPWDDLLHRDLLSTKVLNEIYTESRYKNNPLLTCQKLISEHRLAESDLGTSLSLHYQVPFIPYNPDQYHIYHNEHMLNISYLKHNLIVILADAQDKPTILMADPSNANMIMEVEQALNLVQTEIAVGLPQHILQYLGETNIASSPGDMDEILDEISTSTDEDDEQVDELSDDAPAIVRLVSRILHDAKRLDASDIHIDPEKNGPTRVRMRVDGVCHDLNNLPASHHNAVIARIKIMANLNIAEKRIPQDGKLAFKLSGQLVEVRVATIPTVAGEGVVMRILATVGAMPLSKMNIVPSNLQMLQQMIVKPHGILLVVGPTGSGKTTTLHAILGHLNTPDKKIWTAEDPVEITQPGLQQVQIAPKINFTFATALRAFLRADPDIILIGEMRDKETAHAGIEASLTGHLVLSTLHTNSAPETITRLLDLGLDPVNFSDACVGILAQRLIRTLCPECKEPHTASETEHEFIERQYGDEYLYELDLADNVTLYRAQGCDACGDSGYKGRTGVHELLSMTPALRALIYRKASAHELAEQARSDGMRTLIQDALRKLLKGDTDIKQIQILGGLD